MRPRAHRKRPKDPAHIVLDGPLRKVQPPSNFCVRGTLSMKRPNFAFAFGKLRDPPSEMTVSGALVERLDARTERRVAAFRQTHDIHDIVNRRAFQ